MRKRAVRAALNAARNRPGAARRRTRSRGCRVEACRRSVVARGSDLRSSRSSQSSVSWPSMAPSRGSRYLRQSSSSSERASTRYVVTSPMPSRTTTGPAAPGGSSSGVRIRAPLGSGGAGHAPTAARDRAELPWLAGRRGQAVGEPDREHSTSEAKARRAARTVVPGHRAPDRSAAALLRDQVCLMLLGWLGLRKDEFRRLRVRDVDLATETIVVHGKGDMVVVLPIGFRRLLDALSLELVGREPDEYVLSPKKERDRPMDAASVFRWWRKCLARPGWSRSRCISFATRPATRSTRRPAACSLSSFSGTRTFRVVPRVRTCRAR